MTTKAFVIIETAVGKTREVVTKVRQLEGVKSVDPVTGPYDIIAILEAESLNDIGDMVTGKIQPVDEITRTVVCLTLPC